MEDKRDILYKNLLNTGKVGENEIGNLEEFKAAVKDKESAYEFHRNLLEAGFTVDEIESEEDFYNSISADFDPKHEGVLGRSMNPDWEKNVQKPTVQPAPATTSQSVAQVNPVHEGMLGRSMNPEWNQHILTPYNRKKLDDFSDKPKFQSYDNVRDYYSGKFSMTDEGVQAQEEIAEIQKDLVDTMMGRMKMSDEYKAIMASDAAPGDKDKALEALWAREYQPELDKYMQPYVDEYGEKIIKRYGQFMQGDYRQLDKDNTANSWESISNRIEQAEESLDKTAGGWRNVGRPTYEDTVARAGREAASQARNEKVRQISAARSMMERSQQMIKSAQAGKDGSVLGNIGRGLRDEAFNLDNWTFGVKGMRDGKACLDVMEKYERGEKLTNEEEILMDAMASNAATQAYFASDLGRAYGVGAVTGASLPFMLDMMTGMSVVSGATKAASKGLLKWIAKKGLQAGTKKTLTKGGVGLTKGLIDSGLHTATFGAARVGENYMDRAKGDVKFDISNEGKVQYNGRENMKTGAGALSKAFASTMLEAQSELIGNQFAPMLGFVGKQVKRIPGISKIPASAVGRLAKEYSGSAAGKMMKDYMARTQFHGVFGEYAEEVYNNIGSTLLGDMTVDQLTDFDQNLDTFLGVGLMSAAFGAVGTGAFIREKYKTRKEMRDFEKVMRENMDYDDIKASLKDADIEGAKAFIKQVMSYGSLSSEERKEEIKYITNVLRESAMESAEKEVGNESLSNEEIEANKATIFTEFEKARENLQSSVAPEILAMVDAGQDVSSISMPEDQEMAVVDYLAAKKDFNDYMNSVRNKTTEAKMEARREVEGVSNPDMGAVVRVTRRGSDVPINIVGGKITFDEEGFIDEENSDGTIYYIDENGVRKMGTPKDFEKLVDSTDTESVAQQAEMEAEERVLAEEQAELPQPYMPQPGEEVVLPNGYRGTVAGMQDSETVIVSNGESTVSAKLGEVQPAGQAQPVNETPVASTQQAQPVEETQESVTGSTQENDESVASEAQPQEEEKSTAMPMLGEGEDVEPDFTSVDPQRSYEYLYGGEGGLTPEEASAFVEANIAEKQKAVDKLSAKAPKMGTSLAKYRKAQAEWKAQADEAQKALDYWKAVKGKRDEVKAAEAEEARKVKAGEEVAGVIREMGEPMNGEELAATMLANGAINLRREDFGKETGYGNAEANKLFGLFRTKANGGVSLHEAGELVMQADREAGTNFFDQNDPNAGRNAILDVLSASATPSDLREYIKKNREAQAQKEAQAERDYFDNIIQATYHMTLEEFELYNEVNAGNPYEGVDLAEIDAIFAEHYINQLNTEQNGQTTEQRGIAEQVEGSEGILSPSQPGNPGNPAEVNQEWNPGEDSAVAGENDGNVQGIASGEQVDETGRTQDSQAEVHEQGGGVGQDTQKDSEIPETDVKPLSGGVLDIASSIATKQDIRDQVNTEPTEAQKEAGNYKMGHLKVDGLDVSIENPKGSTRSGKDASGAEWSVTMNNDYGYIRRTEGADGDHVDVFLSDNPEQGDVFVVDQVKVDGSFDEHKVMYGFNSEEEARAAYLANYSPGWNGLGAITRASKEEFKEWVKDGAKKGVPFAGRKNENKGSSVAETIRQRKGWGFPKRNTSKPDMTQEPEDTPESLFEKEKEIYATEEARGLYAQGLRESKTWQEAVEFFRKKKSEFEAEAEDWKNRKYKKNGGSVLVRSDEDLDGWEERSVDGINERRRRNAINSALYRAQECEEFAQTLMKRVGVTESDLNKKGKEYKSVKSQNHLLDDGEVSGIIKAMKDNATVIPFIEITDSNWRNSINTPIGSVKMGENQRTKLFNKGREQQYGMLVESLYNPDIILEEQDKETDMFHERPSSYLFVKTFIKENGEKYVHFESVTVSQEGLEVSISSHIIRENQLKNKLKSDRLLYKATALDKSANSSAEQPTNTGGSLSSKNKDNKPAAEKQTDGLKSSELYSITPAQYTTKRGKVLDMQLVTFNKELSKDEFRSVNALAKSLKGWFDAKQRGFMMRNEEDARKLVEHALSVSKSDEAIEYRYRLTIRPFSIGTQPDGHLRHEDDGSPYGVVVYDHPLTRQEAENFSLTPLTEAKELEGKSFEVPFGKGTLKYQVDSVDENGRVKFLINGAHERSLPYYKFLDEIGEKAKEVTEEARHDATEKQHVGEKGSTEIEAAWKKRISDYIKEHYPAISERSENGMAQRIASRKDKVLTEMRNKAELEITAMKDKEGVFGERVPVVSGDFPKGLPEHKVITMKQKGGKNTVTENVYAAMVDGDLYVQRYVKGDDLKNISIRIPGAKKYDFNEIKYRLDLGIGTSTDAVRLMGDAIDSLYKRGDFQENILEKAERIAKEFEEKTKRQAVLSGKTSEAGKEIVSLEQWKQMSGGERMAEANLHPLLREEIENASSDDVLKANALDYLQGNHGMIQSISYLKVYEDVRYSNGNSAANSGTTNQSQLDEANTGSQQGLDGTSGGSRRVSSELLDSEQGEGTLPRDGGHVQHSENSEKRDVASPGEGSNNNVSGKEQRVGGSSVRSGKRGGSSDGSRNGRNGEQRGTGRSNQGVGNDRERGTETDRRGNSRNGGSQSISEDVDSFLADALEEFEGVLDEFKRAGKEELNMSLAGMSSRQMEVLPRLIAAGAKVGYAYLKKGVHNFAEWAKQMRTILGEKLRSAGLGENEIDAFIAEMWKSKLPIDGEVHTIEEWASVLSKAELRKKVGESLEEKRKAQQNAEPIAVKVCDLNNIVETLPFLLPQQQEDVLKAETQFFDESHNDRDHAFGKGYMFTNGTGTGKTYTGLGIVKRFIKQGKGRVLVLTPSQTKVNDWVKDAKNLGIELKDLDAVAKAKKNGSTATTEKGEGAVITTYANFRQNKALLEDLFDLIVYDESHRLLENKGGVGTAGSLQHYKLSNRNDMYAYLRLQEINPTWISYNEKMKEFTAKREKTIDRLKKEYGITNELVLGQRGELPPVFNGNWTDAAEQKFPELAKLRKEVKALEAKFENEVKPELEQQAKKNMKHTKVVFLSATPFNTRENLDYAEGYIFSYPEQDKQVGYANQSKRSQFYLEHFGAGYKWRYNRLESSTSNPESVSKQEVEFSDYLQHTLQTMSGRIIDSPYDYSRDFPTVTMEKAEVFNAAMEKLSTNEATRGAYGGLMGDYNYTSALFESMKVAHIIPRLKEHLARGRKAVVFHRRIESKEPLKRPFETILNVSEAYWTDQYMQHNSDKTKAKNMLFTIEGLRKSYADLLTWEQMLDLRMPREQLADAFGKDNILFFSGKESKKVKDKAVQDFNNDESGKNIIVIQEASGKEGISLHDTTGKHQRVLVTLALPQSPITALQIEGRIYRIGNKSNAIFEYPLLGLNAELMLFGQRFNQQVSTTENLALGSQARNLRESFARGVEERSGNIDVDSQGIGGKELDAPSTVEGDAFDRAVLDYYTNQKLTGKRDSRAGQDYYPTPEPLGYMMNMWGRIGEGESVLEPSAGHGAIARYVPRENPLTAVEPSHNLFGKLQLKAGGNGRKFENDIFENYNVVNKHDVVLMNPPFGVGGRMAVDHVAKAFQHLDEGGRIVAIIPRGSTDKKFAQWYERQNDAVLAAEIGLPDITFERAGTSVNCRVVVIDKVSNKSLRSDAASRAVHLDLSGIQYGKIEDFFEDIRDISVPERTIDYKAKMKKKAAPVARELRGLKGIQNVELDEDRIFVNGRGLWSSLQWGDRQGAALLNHLSEEYVRFKKSEEYAISRENGLQEAVYGELKELCCKLAGMTEDEMQRHIDRSAKDEDLYREDDWDNKKTPITDQPNRANEKPVSGSVPASIHRDSSSNAMASKQADAKIEKDTQSTKTKIKKYRNGDFIVNTDSLDKALSGIGTILSMRSKGGSRYSVLRTNGGDVVAIRLSDHLANGNNFKRDHADANLSIVIERHVYETQSDSDIEYTEAVIKQETFSRNPEKVINAIVNGVNDVLEDKEFTLDSSIGEVSIEGPIRIKDENLYREVTDDSELAWLENQPTVKAYRAMQVIDGRLYSPMASGKKKNLGAGYGLNKWDVATEMAFNVTDEMLAEIEKLNNSNEKGYVNVIPGVLRFEKASRTGKASLKYHLVTDETDVWAAYNPYNHNSDSMLNDQFKAAYRRGNIVVVEAEVPVEDLESGYQAPYSKDAVGKTEWKSGDVAAQFPDEMKRTVYLSRYTKPVRILSNTEVAKWIGERLRKAEQITGEPITLYEASFHPEVKRLLEADGFTFVPVEQPKGKVSKVLEGHPDYMSDDKIAAINEALSNQDSWLQRGGDSSFSDEELSYENEPIAQRMRERMVKHANELAELLKLNNVEILEDTAGLKGRKARAKGWFDPNTGKIVVVLPNHKNIYDVQQTILHEAVAHYGLRQLFGKHFNDFLDNVYNNASSEIRSRIAQRAVEKKWDIREATEEYLAGLAEHTNFEEAHKEGWFQQIKDFFIRMLAKAGIRLAAELTDNELRYILWRSYDNLKNPGGRRKVLDEARDIATQYELGVGDYEGRRGDAPLFRDVDDGSTKAYEKLLKGVKYKFREAYQDSMLALKNLQKVIAEHSGKPIQAFEDAHMAENHLSSKNTDEARRYYDELFKPLMQEVSKITKGDEKEYNKLSDYLILKHGIERNIEYTMRAFFRSLSGKYDEEEIEQYYSDYMSAKNSLRKELAEGTIDESEYLEQFEAIALEYVDAIEDYSGTRALLGRMVAGEAPKGVAEKEKTKFYLQKYEDTYGEDANFQNLARGSVNDYENIHATSSLWDKVNKATKVSLRKSYESGMMERDNYNNVKDMFLYYVPLRGWDEQTANDVYEYLGSEVSPVNSVLKTAKGRRSIPDNPLPVIGNMAESTIIQGNRNMMKQAFLNLVQNHPTSVATLQKAWYVQDEITGEWYVSYPDIEPTDTAEEIADKVNDHQKRMEELEEKGLATQKRGKLNINYRLNRWQAKEHFVQVKRNGKDYVIYINGNPRAAQALNGMTNPDAVTSKPLQMWNAANRWLAANFTTRNLAFVVSNLSRDLIFAQSAVMVKESPEYAGKFFVNAGKAMGVVMRNIKGKGKETDEMDRYFREFVENGGETGYMHLTDVNQYKKKIKRELERMSGKEMKAKAAARYCIDRLDDLNRWAEDISRYATYVTSRQMGRSIQESVRDAKEITVNFNKKGAGLKTGGWIGASSGLFHGAYLFFKVGIQSLVNFGRLAKNHPAKFGAMIGSFVAAGVLVPAVINPMLYAILGGVGDDDPYKNLSEWERKNNLCIYAGGGGFIKVPLPIELRAFYGLGEMSYDFMTRKTRVQPTEVAFALANQITELLPINLLGNNGDIVANLLPDILQPWYEISENKDYAGRPVYKDTPFNELDPEFKRVYKGTSGWLVDVSQYLNEATGGNDFRKGEVDFNPAKIEHIYEYYFGGMGKTINQLGKTIWYGSKSIMEGEKDENLVLRNVPILNRFFSAPDEKSAFAGVNKEYFRMVDEWEIMDHELKGLAKKGAMMNPKYLQQFIDLTSSDQYKWYKAFEAFKNNLDGLYKMRGSIPDEEMQKQLDEQIMIMKRQAIDEMEKFSK